MSNKISTTKKKMAALGLKKTTNGDYDYINAEEKNRSKFKSVRKENKQLK